MTLLENNKKVTSFVYDDNAATKAVDGLPLALELVQPALNESFEEGQQIGLDEKSLDKMEKSHSELN